MQAKATAVNSVVWHSRDFAKGLAAGLAGNSRVYDLSQGCNESVIVEMVRSMCERATDDELSYERLAYDCGLLVGYVLSST